MEYTQEHFYNREISWLEFNNRVLEEAFDKENPLMERLKFLAITSSNLDEFVMIRLAGIKEQIEANYKKKDVSGKTPKEQLDEISEKAHNMVNREYNCLNRSILPKLEADGKIFVKYNQLTPQQSSEIKQYYDENIFPIITPMGIDNSRPLPHVGDKTLNIIVRAFDKKEEHFSFVQVPGNIKRFLKVPFCDNDTRFIMLEEVIRNNLDSLFEGCELRADGIFRITRNGDLTIDEEEAEDLLLEIEKSIKNRKWGFPTRLEIEKNIDPKLEKFLLKTFKMNKFDIFEIQGPLDLSFLFDFTGIADSEHLKYKDMPPNPPEDFYHREDIFEVIREKDRLIHHPYESFQPVIDFIKQAARDPNVLAIKQTLYRVSGDSPIISALMEAVENEKQVTVLLELKARFDEARNITWAKKLEKAGCHVVYGLIGLKTHSKVTLIVRQEDSGIIRYVHLGTGNYNDKTAKLYTDLSFFTCNPLYSSDVSKLFNVLTGYSMPRDFKKIFIAPYNLKEKLLMLINREIDNARNNREAKIIAKMNSLVDKDLIELLYEASQAGVKIELIVRGICCLKSGIKDISENIVVRSVVGRFLEHSRIYYFYNNGNCKIYLSSADWMPRNLYRRIETMFPIEEEYLKQKIEDILNITLRDTQKSRIQLSDGSYHKIDKRGKPILESQIEFYKQAEKNIFRIKEKEKEKIK